MKIFENFDLTNYNSYRIKSMCKRALFPESQEDIINLYNNEKSDKYILLGRGYNVILSKQYYENEFVIFSDTFNHIEYDGDESITCQSGCDMKQISQFCLENSLSGLEIFYDIPSSLGGAVVMNAGASGEDIQGMLVKVWYFNPDSKKVEIIEKKDIGFEYRNSFFQRNPRMIVCKALLKLVKRDKSDILSKMEDIKSRRWAKQPRDMPNAGSVFKRPKERFVGPMIDELGLKGFAIGGAKISEKHSGFIVNYNNATGSDVISLIEFVKEKVRSKFFIELETEQRII